MKQDEIVDNAIGEIFEAEAEEQPGSLRKDEILISEKEMAIITYIPQTGDNHLVDNTKRTFYTKGDHYNKKLVNCQAYSDLVLAKIKTKFNLEKKPNVGKGFRLLKSIAAIYMECGHHIKLNGSIPIKDFYAGKSVKVAIKSDCEICFPSKFLVLF